MEVDRDQLLIARIWQRIEGTQLKEEKTGKRTEKE